MKKMICVLSIIVSAFLVTACSVPIDAPKTGDTTSSESPAKTISEVEDDIIECLKSRIEMETDLYDCEICIFQMEDGVYVSVHVGSVANEIAFADVLLGTLSACESVFSEFNCPISELSVSSGKDSSLNWITNNLKTGYFCDFRNNVVEEMSFSEVVEYCGYEEFTNAE